MINTSKVNAYTQHAIKQNTVNATQADSVKSSAKSGVRHYTPEATDVLEISKEAKEVSNKDLFEIDEEKISEKKDKSEEWKDKLEQMRSDMN